MMERKPSHLGSKLRAPAGIRGTDLASIGSTGGITGKRKLRSLAPGLRYLLAQFDEFGVFLGDRVDDDGKVRVSDAPFAIQLERGLTQLAFPPADARLHLPALKLH